MRRRRFWNGLERAWVHLSTISISYDESTGSDEFWARSAISGNTRAASQKTRVEIALRYVTHGKNTGEISSTFAGTCSRCAKINASATENKRGRKLGDASSQS
jgi:hypothetical protein